MAKTKKEGYLEPLVKLYQMHPGEKKVNYLTPRWFIERPPYVQMTTACGYRINEDINGILVRDELEAETLATRLAWDRAVPFPLGEDERREAYTPTDEELVGLPQIPLPDRTRDNLELWPYEKLLRLANGLKTAAPEISQWPTRRELAQFVRDKRRSRAAASRVPEIDAAVQEAVAAALQAHGISNVPEGALAGPA